MAALFGSGSSAMGSAAGGALTQQAMQPAQQQPGMPQQGSPGTGPVSPQVANSFAQGLNQGPNLNENLMNFLKSIGR